MLMVRLLNRRFKNSIWSKQFCNAGDSSQQTHFGFETVDENEKSRKVYEVFENVASRYDLMNDVMSFGVHRWWKDRFVERLDPFPGASYLDVAGGTGDVAFRILRHLRYKKMRGIGRSRRDRKVSGGYVYSKKPSGLVESDERKFVDDTQISAQHSVTVCDINQSMLDVGQQRAIENECEKDILWVKGDAEMLPFGDNCFDAYTIAFGIRNCTHVNRVLEEAYRVLRPGGRFLCLEFSHVNQSLLNNVYDWYSFGVIPVMGQIIAADWKSYQYLVESIRQFPGQDDFADMIRNAGFRAVTYENKTFGIVAVHSGFKL